MKDICLYLGFILKTIAYSIATCFVIRVCKSEFEFNDIGPKLLIFIVIVLIITGLKIVYTKLIDTEDDELKETSRYILLTIFFIINGLLANFTLFENYTAIRTRVNNEKVYSHSEIEYNSRGKSYEYEVYEYVYPTLKRGVYRNDSKILRETIKDLRHKHMAIGRRGYYFPYTAVVEGYTFYPYLTIFQKVKGYTFEILFRAMMSIFFLALIIIIYLLYIRINEKING